MQWYFASLAMLLILAGAGALTGALVIAPLPTRMQPGARVFLCVPLGWALLTLVATLLGWFGHGFGGWHCAGITLGLSAAGAWTGRHWLRAAAPDAVRLATFCVIASFPILGSLWLHGSFDNYNDTFLYICHGQWLQAHGFLEHAHTDGGHPAWGSVVFLRDANLRMGSSFLLGWVQAMFGCEWSYEVFPLVAALGVICGALGAGATVLAACPGRWVEAWLTALAVAVTVNGFTFGAASGFLPQTWGLAFAAGATGLRGLELGTHAERSGGGAWRTGVPFGVCVAASMHCYWDLLPLEGPALGLTYLLPWQGWSILTWRRVWARASVPALMCLLLVNVEWLRAVPGIFANVTAVVANPVAWRLWDFLAHALGLKSSVWEGGHWIVQDAGRFLMLGGSAVLMVGLAVMAISLRRKQWRRWVWTHRGAGKKWRVEPLLPALVWVLLTTALIIHFRYFVASPWREQNMTQWPDGVGQSWSQYKLTVWGSVAFISLAVGLGTGWTMRSGASLQRSAWVVILVIWCGTGLGWNYLLAWRHGKSMWHDAGVRRDPFAVCRAMHERLSTLPPNQWIYLDWPTNGSRKYCELMAYFLYDHPVAANWGRAGYVASYITDEDARRTAADCEWVLKYRPPDGGSSPPGGMTLERGGR